MDDAEAAMMRVLYDEHAGALWRYVMRLTGDAARAGVRGGRLAEPTRAGAVEAEVDGRTAALVRTDAGAGQVLA